ncbi:unnamed protein product, partial [Brassica oleracea]
FLTIFCRRNYSFENKTHSLLNLSNFSLNVLQNFISVYRLRLLPQSRKSDFVLSFMFRFAFGFHWMVCMLILMVISLTFRSVLDMFCVSLL